MKNPTTKKPTHKSPRSKNPGRVGRQLDTLTPKETDAAIDFEKPTGADTVDETGEAKSKPSEISRAHTKAGIAEPTQDVLEAFAQKLSSAGVDIMSKTSSRIAKTIKGQLTVEALKA
jgi:hypothetical protein